MKVTVIGTGYVGLVSGTCLAEVGNDVLCLDVDAEKIRILEEGGVPIFEPGLQEMVRRNVAAGRLHFTTDVQRAVDHGTIQFIAVGTPPDEDGSADLKYVLAVAETIGRLLDRHRIVVTNRTQAKAVALIEQHAAIAALHKVELVALERQVLETDLAQNFDIIINATASSLAGADVPAPASVLHARSLAYDMMYGPAAQNFLSWASSHGALARDGLGMLVEQAAESFALWRGVRPPSTQVLAELRALLLTEAAH